MVAAEKGFSRSLDRRMTDLSVGLLEQLQNHGVVGEVQLFVQQQAAKRKCRHKRPA
jgi:hypothetical protein